MSRSPQDAEAHSGLVYRWAGRRIDMTLSACGVAITADYRLDALLAGGGPPRYGNAHPSIVPYGVFDAADGPIGAGIACLHSGLD